VLVLDTHDTTTPGSSESVVVVELALELGGEVLKVGEVFTADLGEGNAGSGLLVDELTEGSLTTDEGEGNTLLSAESREEDHQLDGVDVVSNDNQLSLLLFNEGGHVVETELEMNGLLSLLVLGGFSLRLKSKLLLLSVLGRVFSEELDKVGSLVLLESLSELVNGRGDLQSLEENSLLSLNTDVLGPLDKSGEVSLGLDVTTDSEVSRALLEKGALLSLISLATGSDDNLLSFSNFLGLYNSK